MSSCTACTGIEGPLWSLLVFGSIWLLVGTECNFKAKEYEEGAQCTVHIVANADKFCLYCVVRKGERDKTKPGKGHERHFKTVEELNVFGCGVGNDLREQCKEEQGGLGVESVREKAGTERGEGSVCCVGASWCFATFSTFFAPQSLYPNIYKVSCTNEFNCGK